MSRLIDVDWIVDSDIANCLGAEYCSCVPDARDMLNDQPTAYDVEAVVKELEDLKMSYFLTLANTGDADRDCAYLNTANAIDRAIEIVKGGGTDATDGSVEESVVYRDFMKRSRN